MKELNTTYIPNSLKATWLDYVLLLLIIAFTGFEFCYNYAEGIFFIVGPLSLYLFFKRHRRINKSVFIFILLLIVWIIGQFITSQSAPSALFNFLVRFIIYIIAAFSINEFEKVFIRLIVFFSILSIPLWFISNYVPNGYGLLTSTFPEFKFGTLGLDAETSSNPGYSIGLYYVSRGARNAGPFWEPGMFAVFLNIALAMLLVFTRKPFCKTSIILLIALFTTFSTTGYISAMLILAWYFTFIDRKPQSVVLIVILGMGLVAFMGSDFGQSKIENTMRSKAEHSRFYAMIYHFKLLTGHYLTGCGFNSKSIGSMLTSPNGLSLIFYFWGIPFGIYYFIRLYYSARRIIKSITVNSVNVSVIILYITLLVVVFSQDISTRHFYYFLLVYGFVPIRYKYFVK